MLSLSGGIKNTHRRRAHSLRKIIENGVFTNVNEIVFGDFQSVIQYKMVTKESKLQTM